MKIKLLGIFLIIFLSGCTPAKKSKTFTKTHKDHAYILFEWGIDKWSYGGAVHDPDRPKCTTEE